MVFSKTSVTLIEFSSFQPYAWQYADIACSCSSLELSIKAYFSTIYLFSFNFRLKCLNQNNSKGCPGNSLAVQWLGLCALAAEGLGSIPGQELRSHKPSSQKKQNKKYPPPQKNTKDCPIWTTCRTFLLLL